MSQYSRVPTTDDDCQHGNVHDSLAVYATETDDQQLHRENRSSVVNIRPYFFFALFSILYSLGTLLGSSIGYAIVTNDRVNAREKWQNEHLNTENCVGTFGKDLVHPTVQTLAAVLNGTIANPDGPGSCKLPEWAIGENLENSLFMFFSANVGMALIAFVWMSALQYCISRCAASRSRPDSERQIDSDGFRMERVGRKSRMSNEWAVDNNTYDGQYDAFVNQSNSDISFRSRKD